MGHAPVGSLSSPDAARNLIVEWCQHWGCTGLEEADRRDSLALSLYLVVQSPDLGCEDDIFVFRNCLAVRKSNTTMYSSNLKLAVFWFTLRYLAILLKSIVRSYRTVEEISRLLRHNNVGVA